MGLLLGDRPQRGPSQEKEEGTISVESGGECGGGLLSARGLEGGQ